MFKLLKELAKAPEPLLSASGSHSPYSAHSSDGGDFGSLGYKPRSRAGTLQQPYNLGAGNAGASGSGSGAAQGAKADDAEETDPDAVKIVQLLAGLKTAKTVMEYVEVSRLPISIPIPNHISYSVDIFADPQRSRQVRDPPVIPQAQWFQAPGANSRRWAGLVRAGGRGGSGLCAGQGGAAE